MYLLKWLSERRTAVKLIQDPIQQSSGLLLDDCKWSGFKFVGNRTVSVIDFWTDCFHVIGRRERIMVNNLINSLNYFLEFMNPYRFRVEPPPWSQHPVKVSGLKSCERVILVTWSKDHVVLRVGASRSNSARYLVCVYRSSASGDMYFICHLTLQYQPIDLSCKFMGGSSSRYMSTLTSLVTIVILIIKREYDSSKTWILQICTATEKLSWLDKH